MKIGEKIKLSREERKITQKELAKKTGISNTYLSDIERMRTNPSIKVLQQLADALEEAVSSFLE